MTVFVWTGRSNTVLEGDTSVGGHLVALLNLKDTCIHASLDINVFVSVNACSENVHQCASQGTIVCQCP